MGSAPSKAVPARGTAWEERCGSARAVRTGDAVHVSGTCAEGDTPAAQVAAIFASIDKAIREAGGRGLEDVVVTRMIAADVQRDWQALSDAHKAAFAVTHNRNTPANTLYGGSLPLPWMLVEVEATAVIQPHSGRRVCLVTGATGRIGKEVVARLAKSGVFHIRAALHNPDRSEYLHGLGAHEVVKFDYTDPATWGPALADVEVIYSSSLDPLLEHYTKFATHLGTLGGQIKHLVRISATGAETNTALYDKDTHVSREGAGIPLMLQHYWWGEKAVIEAGIPVTCLRANFFMNHLLKTDTENIDKEGFFSNPVGKTRNSFVCTNDVGEAAAVVLLEGPAKHANKFYELTGPVPQSMDEIAADLGKAMGKTVEYRAQSFEQFEKDFGPTRAALFEYLCNGFYTRCSPDLQHYRQTRSTLCGEVFEI
eukprot:Hpha_TRINITY_DN11479_c0_g1::TRINITY_DN11479_c0_g1_i1::g.137405::m.137405